MTIVGKIKDSLSNIVANIGTSRDKSYHNAYTMPCYTDADFINAYRGAWLPRKIVDIPALDACRKWREWQADKEQIEKIELLEKKLGVKGKVLEALTKSRLFGGAAIYIGTGDADPSRPISETAKIKHLTVFIRRQLTPGQLVEDSESSRYGQPENYTVANTAQIIHPSRLVIFKGAPLPDEELATGQEFGWGDSVLTAIFKAIEDADSTTANVASLIFEAKVDVIKIPDFMDKLTDPAFETEMLTRLELAARAKGINGALLLDAKEEYEQKSANFSNLKDIIFSFMQVVSGAADIPITRLLGQSPGGLQATGDNDIRNYYDRISSMQELEVEPALEILDKLIVFNALGQNDLDVTYNWSSLWQSTDKERAEIGNNIADMIKKVSETELINHDALSQAAITTLSEAGVMPGLQQAVDDIGAPSEEDSEDDLLSALDSGKTPS